LAWQLDRIDMFCDAVPRDHGRPEPHGSLTLFVRVGTGWPYYARPTRGAQAVSADDISAVRDRQRELGLPESFEWIDEITPTMRPAAEKAGLRVLAHPLMVLSRHTPPPDIAANVRLIDADEPSALELVRQRMRSGRMLFAGGFDTGHDGPVAVGCCQILVGVAEIVGVGTLPVVRRRGLGAAVTARLAAAALARGAETVFLSAADDEVVRMYERLGFIRVGTSMVAGPAAV
jgi:ribosomal protein S18 acetylase RimI-like enzyme